MLSGVESSSSSTALKFVHPPLFKGVQTRKTCVWYYGTCAGVVQMLKLFQVTDLILLTETYHFISQHLPHVEGFDSLVVACTLYVTTPLWDKCEGEAHTPKSGKLESSETREISKLDFRGQIPFHSSVLYVIGKVLKCRCPKWLRMSHLDICNPSYGQKKGRESTSSRRQQ